MLFALMALTTLLGIGIAGGFGDRVGPVPLLNVQGSAYVLAGLLALARLRGLGGAPAVREELASAAEPPAVAAPEMG